MVYGVATTLSQAPRAVNSAQPAHWQPPPSDWLKLNFDGSRNNQNGSSACGGVLCDATKWWVGGFARHLDSCSIVETELWGIHGGLLQA
ncbi:hypothetical protein V6N13_098341 [Hibiscus sabdariffa]